jgi:hypothetical protein
LINTMLTEHVTGRASREEEDPQGPREEKNNLHPPLRQRDHDWWQEEDESQPDYINT